MANVLIVEDDQDTAGMLTNLVGALGHQVALACTGKEALSLAADRRPDVVLLDLGLPDLSGIDVIARLRSWSDTHILVVSGSRQVRRKADALDAGADDFIDKPFDVSELRARLRLAERKRDLALQRPTQRRFGKVVVDYTHRRLHLGDDEVRLTDIEWALLDGLSREPGRLVTHRWLMTHVWGTHAGSDALVAMRTHMRALRAKLGDDARQPHYIRTETGLGYRWVASPVIEASRLRPLPEVLGRLNDVHRDLDALVSSQSPEGKTLLTHAGELLSEAVLAVRQVADARAHEVEE